MMCKNCGENMPEPEPRVVVREKQVDRSEAHYWLRAIMVIAAVIISVIVGLVGVSMYRGYIAHKAIDDPTVKIEIIEYDDAGRVVRKFTR